MTVFHACLGIPDHLNLRITRTWCDDALVIDDAQGRDIDVVGILLGIDMRDPPPNYFFEVQLFPAHAYSAPKLSGGEK